MAYKDITKRRAHNAIYWPRWYCKQGNKEKHREHAKMSYRRKAAAARAIKEKT